VVLHEFVAELAKCVAFELVLDGSSDETAQAALADVPLVAPRSWRFSAFSAAVLAIGAPILFVQRGPVEGTVTILAMMAFVAHAALRWDRDRRLRGRQGRRHPRR
jgi:hypothetical protein